LLHLELKNDYVWHKIDILTEQIMKSFCIELQPKKPGLTENKRLGWFTGLRWVLSTVIASFDRALQ